MKIYRSKGTEGTCPRCSGGNAMLNNHHWSMDKIVPSLKCRDCGFTVDNPEVIEVEYEDLITRYRGGVDNERK